MKFDLYQIDPEIYQILTWSTTCCILTVEKVSSSEEKKTYLFEEFQKTLGKTETLDKKPPREHSSVSVLAVRSLPSVRQWDSTMK